MDWASFWGAIFGSIITAITSFMLLNKSIKANLKNQEKQIKTQFLLNKKFILEQEKNKSKNEHLVSFKVNIKILINNIKDKSMYEHIEYNKSIIDIQYDIETLKSLFEDKKEIKNLLENMSWKSTVLLDHVKAKSDRNVILNTCIDLQKLMDSLINELKQL